jgi:hypothetical protein
MRRFRHEKELYPVVQDWLVHEKYETGQGHRTWTGRRWHDRSWVNIGLRNTRFDLIGVRSIGSKYHDEVDVVAVEVKLEKRVRIQHLNQAVGYMRYVDRAYFAFTGEFEQELVDEARRIGLGLLQVKLGGRPSVREILGASNCHPHTNRRLELLHSMWIHRCALCGLHFFGYTHDDEGCRKPNYVALKRARVLPRGVPGEESTFEVRLCEECAPLLGYRLCEGKWKKKTLFKWTRKPMKLGA